MSARIFQLNMSSGGVPKLPVREASIETNGLVGDVQTHTKIHGGPMRAVCLYSLERILELQAEGHRIYPGSIGENITITGLPWTSLEVGQRWAFGDEVILELVKPTDPCKNIAASFVDGNFKRVDHRGDALPHWSRWYTRVERIGRVRVGDAIQRVLL
jgi:MOSC domain-containing protein YiiM